MKPTGTPPLTETDYLLICLAEECAEVAKACSKALRFGLEHRPNGKPLENKELIVEEMYEALTLLSELQMRKVLPVSNFDQTRGRKVRGLEFYMKYSRQCGRLSS